MIPSNERLNRPAWFDGTILESLQKHTSDNSAEHGYYVYQLDALKAHLAQLKKQDTVKLWFAVKANPLSSIIQSFDDENFNFDVASSGELFQVLKQGVSAKNILNTGPAKSKKQLKHFVQQGVTTFVVESLNQLNWLHQVAIEQGVQPKVLLRVQLQWPDGEKNPLGGNTLTPFGLSTQEWSTIRASDYPQLNLCGLHIFQWGNMLSNEAIFSLWSQMVTPLVKLAEQIGMRLDILDLGGGLGIDYLQQGKTLSWDKIIADLAVIKKAAGVQELWLELGRYAVAQCGYYVVPVVDRKTNFDQQQLVLAAGINHLLRPAITEQPFPVNLLRASEESMCDFEIHGPLCTSMDKLGTLPLPADIKVGDQLVFGLCGAYGFTESMPFFLCHEIAAEYTVSRGEMSVVRHAEPASWYLR